MDRNMSGLMLHVATREKRQAVAVKATRAAMEEVLRAIAADDKQADLVSELDKAKDKPGKK